MSSITNNGSSSGLDSLVQQLVGRIDKDQNGQISTEEFGGFLSQLLAASTAASQSSGEGGASTSAPTVSNAAAPATGAAEIPPSQWTGNNAPYGVTFAGFSPQDHTDLTSADLAVPGKAEKYAVYSYLLANRIQPSKDWAPGVADALNTKYNTNVFKAIDGETLGYGNEYIHSASNGYGLLPGQYNENANGEFFWGWV